MASPNRFNIGMCGARAMGIPVRWQNQSIDEYFRPIYQASRGHVAADGGIAAVGAAGVPVPSRRPVAAGGISRHSSLREPARG